MTMEVSGRYARYRLRERTASGPIERWDGNDMTPAGTAVIVEFAPAGVTAALEDENRYDTQLRNNRTMQTSRILDEDWGRDGEGRLFFVRQRPPAPSLGEIIGKRHVSPDKAIELMMSLLGVLSPVHARNIFHKDLTPSRVFAARDGAHIAGFGIARPYDETTGSPVAAGSVAPTSLPWVANEVIEGRTIDDRSDLFSVGVILYRLLSGRAPHDQLDRALLLGERQSVRPPPLSESATGEVIDEETATLIRNAISNRPDERPASAPEFKEELQRARERLANSQEPRGVLDRRYRIVQQLDRDDERELMLAERHRDSVRVELEILHSPEAARRRQALEPEARRGLAHDNIVPFLDFGTFRSEPAVVTGHTPSGSVADIIRKCADTGIPEALFYTIALDVCRGLHHAHHHAILHLAIRPEALRLGADRKILIADFGRGENPSIGAPEQWGDRQVDVRTDVFSVGCVLYELLCMSKPFPHGAGADAVRAQVDGEPPALMVRGVYSSPDALCNVVERCLQKERARRYTSVNDLARDLARIQQEPPQGWGHQAKILHTT